MDDAARLMLLSVVLGLGACGGRSGLNQDLDDAAVRGREDADRVDARPSEMRTDAGDDAAVDVCTAEQCNRRDDDCDGFVDEGLTIDGPLAAPTLLTEGGPLRVPTIIEAPRELIATVTPYTSSPPSIVRWIGIDPMGTPNGRTGEIEAPGVVDQRSALDDFDGAQRTRTALSLYLRPALGDTCGWLTFASPDALPRIVTAPWMGCAGAQVSTGTRHVYVQDYASRIEFFSASAEGDDLATRVIPLPAGDYIATVNLGASAGRVGVLARQASSDPAPYSFVVVDVRGELLAAPLTFEAPFDVGAHVAGLRDRFMLWFSAGISSPSTVVEVSTRGELLRGPALEPAVTLSRRVGSRVALDPRATSHAIVQQREDGTEALLWIIRTGRVVQTISVPIGPATPFNLGVEVYWADNGVLLLSWSQHQIVDDRVASSRAYVQAVGCFEDSR